MRMNSLLRAIVMAASLCVAAGGAVARSSNMLELGRQEVVSPSAATPSTIESMRAAIIAGGAVHGWKALADKPGAMTLEADSGSHQVVVDVAYDAQGYAITYQSSANMNYEQSATRTSIHPKYNKWIEQLSAAIRKAALDAQGK